MNYEASNNFRQNNDDIEIASRLVEQIMDGLSPLIAQYEREGSPDVAERIQNQFGLLSDEIARVATQKIDAIVLKYALPAFQLQSRFYKASLSRKR